MLEISVGQFSTTEVQDWSSQVRCLDVGKVNIVRMRITFVKIWWYFWVVACQIFEAVQLKIVAAELFIYCREVASKLKLV